MSGKEKKRTEEQKEHKKKEQKKQHQLTLKEQSLEP